MNVLLLCVSLVCIIVVIVHQEEKKVCASSMAAALCRAVHGSVQELNHYNSKTETFLVCLEPV